MSKAKAISKKGAKRADSREYTYDEYVQKFHPEKVGTGSSPKETFIQRLQARVNRLLYESRNT